MGIEPTQFIGAVTFCGAANYNNNNAPRERVKGQEKFPGRKKMEKQQSIARPASLILAKSLSSQLGINKSACGADERLTQFRC